MPRAKRRCPKRECRQWQPCPVHPPGWQTSKDHPLPPDHKKWARAVRDRAQSFCEKCLRYAPKGQADHILNRARGGDNSLSNGQWLCPECHTKKTRAERKLGRG